MIQQKDQLIKRIEENFIVLNEYSDLKDDEKLSSARDEMINEFNKFSILDFETICSMDDNSFKHFAALESTELDPKKIYVTQLLLIDIMDQKNSGDEVPSYKYEKLEMLVKEISKYETENVQNVLKFINQISE